MYGHDKCKHNVHTCTPTTYNTLAPIKSFSTHSERIPAVGRAEPDIYLSPRDAFVVYLEIRRTLRHVTGPVEKYI